MKEKKKTKEFRKRMKIKEEKVIRKKNIRK